jgi:hypothetical protein
MLLLRTPGSRQAERREGKQLLQPEVASGDLAKLSGLVEANARLLQVRAQRRDEGDRVSSGGGR